MSIFACSIEHLEFLREVYLKYEQGMYRVEGIDEIPEDAIPSIESTDHFWQVKVKRSKERIEV